MIGLELFFLVVWVVVIGWWINLIRYEAAIWRRDHDAAKRHKERGFF